MKLTLDCPDPKFNRGDVLLWDKLVVYVYRVYLRGEWYYRNGDASADITGNYSYCLSVQGGKGPVNNPIRPGTVLTFTENPYVLDDRSIHDAIKISWDNSIIEPDSIKNISVRQDTWDKLTETEKLAKANALLESLNSGLE